MRPRDGRGARRLAARERTPAENMDLSPSSPREGQVPVNDCRYLSDRMHITQLLALMTHFNTPSAYCGARS